MSNDLNKEMRQRIFHLYDWVFICDVNTTSLTIFIQFFFSAALPMLTNHKEARYYSTELQKSIVHISDLWPAESPKLLARFAPPSLSVTDRSALLCEGRYYRRRNNDAGVVKERRAATAGLQTGVAVTKTPDGWY